VSHGALSPAAGRGDQAASHGTRRSVHTKPVVHRLREATLADAAALARVFIDAWESAYPDILQPDVLAMWQPVPTETWMRELIATPTEATVACLAPDGAICGFTRYGPDPDDRARGQVYSVYVDPAYRRRGVGAAMLRHAIEALGALGYRDASIWLFEANAPARGLYASLGFEPDGATRVEPEFRANEIRMVRSGRSAPAPIGKLVADVW
jgi:ribosomal protein S18 acetylase RimI-like enzyme